MKFITRSFVFCLLGVTSFAQIERRLPPVGIEIPKEVVDATTKKLTDLRSKLKEVDHPAKADADVLLKAVDFAVKHREIYKTDHLKLLGETLALAEERIDALQDRKATWQHNKLTVRGFYSRIDDSPQPYGLVIPEDLPKDKPVPLYVWLHGRGDKTTDIHFIKQRLSKVGQISPKGAIVLHPFGRQCLGFKSAGETDVLEAIDHVKANYNIDSDRVVLMGFSMGGAGAWHIGAHYADQFCAVSPGAGFAETSRYQKLSKEQIEATPWYERQLWTLYDVPKYVRNMFNVPVVCYSGEKDKQIQAARVMEEAFAEHGRNLEHIIGPEMGHKYDEKSLATIMEKMAAAVAQGRDQTPKTISLQTRTLRYSKMHWVHVDRLIEHWEDTRVDAELIGEWLTIETKNVRQLTLDPFPKSVNVVEIDEQTTSPSGTKVVLTKNDDGKWLVSSKPAKEKTLEKQHGLQGPIDDAFLDRFLVVTPDSKVEASAKNKWVLAELQHLRDRWSALFRGTLPEKKASDVTEEDIAESHLILFGDNSNNSITFRVSEKLAPEQIPGRDKAWLSEQLIKSGFHGNTFTAAWICPNPLNPEKYVVFNSGPTFREAHDRTNSLQNPKLPDWVFYDYSVPPNAERSADVVAAGFFDEKWGLQPAK